MNKDIHVITSTFFSIKNEKSGYEFQQGTIQEVYEYFEKRPEIQVDTETQGLDPYTRDILTLQLGDASRQYVIDITTIDIAEFKPLLERKDKLFLFQNAKFDLRFMMHNNINITNIYDTFIAECILTTGIDKRSLGLGSLVEKYTNDSVDKSIRGEIQFKGLSDDVIVYAAHDVKHLSTIKKGQMEKLKEYNLATDDVLDDRTLLGLENKVTRVFASMEYHGVNVDELRWVNNSNDIRKDLEQKQAELDDIVRTDPSLSHYVNDVQQTDLFGVKQRDVDINYASPHAKVKILNDLGFGVDSSSDAILQKYQDDHIFVKSLREYNALSKLSSSFGMSMIMAIHPVTRRFHPEYWQILRTGRISVKNPNTNQIPSKGIYGPKIRSAFTAPEGYKIVGGDYSQMELRELAHFSQDPIWMDIFSDDSKDMHSILCAETFNIPIADVNKPFPDNPDLTYRYIQKTINYGLAYGMSHHKLAKTMNCTEIQAAKIVDAFFSKVPLVKKTLDKFGEFAKTNGYIVTSPPYNRRRWFPEFEEYDFLRKRTEHRNLQGREWYTIKNLGGIMERAGKNTPIQGTNADITKLAMVKAHEYIERNGIDAKIILSVYDEIQTEVHESIAEEWKTELQRIMQEAGESVITTVPIEAECSISNYWNK